MGLCHVMYLLKQTEECIALCYSLIRQLFGFNAEVRAEVIHTIYRRECRIIVLCRSGKGVYAEGGDSNTSESEAGLKK